MVQLHDNKGEEWAVAAKSYAKTTSNISSPVIGKMLQEINAMHPLAEATAILDNGSGPGSIMSTIISQHGSEIPSDCKLSCTDYAESMIDAVRTTQSAEVSKDPSSPWKRVDTTVMDSTDLSPISDSSISHVLAGWVFFLTSNPQKCLTESLRVLKPDGALTVSSWDGQMQWLQLMRLAAKIRPDKEFPTLPEAWTNTSGVRNELEKAGFREVEAFEVATSWPFESHETVGDTVLTNTPQMVSLLKDFSEKEREDLRNLVIEECKKMAPSKPYALKGVSIVGIGRK